MECYKHCSKKETLKVFKVQQFIAIMQQIYSYAFMNFEILDKWCYFSINLNKRNIKIKDNLKF